MLLVFVPVRLPGRKAFVRHGSAAAPCPVTPDSRAESGLHFFTPAT